MAFLNSSNKLGGRGHGYIIYSGKTVFFRVKDHGDKAELMTATADEDDGSFLAYRDQSSLISQTTDILFNNEHSFSHEKDQQNRPYVLSELPVDAADILHLATLILHKLDIHTDVSVQAVREMLDLYDEISPGDGEDGYLGDGVYITSDGRLVHK